jgi:hypothetical protein
MKPKLTIDDLASMQFAIPYYLGRDKILLEMFCAKYRTNLTDIGINLEDVDSTGLMYYFDDGLGGYSFIGIKESLKSE